MWQQLGWDKNHRIKVKYKRRIDETFLSPAADDGSSNVEEAMKGNTVNNPVTLLASGGCTADLVTTALMSLLRHKPPDMNGTQLFN